MIENSLLDLCEAYLLDLIGFLAECMRRSECSSFDIAKDGEYDIPDTILSRIEELDYLQKAEVLADAANHIKAIAKREDQKALLPMTNDQ